VISTKIWSIDRKVVEIKIINGDIGAQVATCGSPIGGVEFKRVGELKLEPHTVARDDLRTQQVEVDA